MTKKLSDRKSLGYSAEDLEVLVNASQAVLAVCECADGCVPIYVSDNVKAHLGYEPEEFLRGARGWIHHVHPDDSASVKAALAKLPTNKHQVLQYRLRRKDGVYRWMQHDMRQLPKARGKPRQFLFSWVDVTEHRRAEEKLRIGQGVLERRVDDRAARLKAANEELKDVNGRLRKEIDERKSVEKTLRESQERTRKIMDNVFDGVIVLDEKGRMLSVNPAAERIFGYRRKGMGAETSRP